MIRAVVIDDEKPSREAISNYLGEFCTDVSVLAKGSSVKTGYKAIRKHSPDVVFLDIELGDGNGFDLLQMFDKIDFKVIFITAYSEYAIKAFRFSAVDYLLKPVKIDELTAAVDKIRSIREKSQSEITLSALLKNLVSGSGIPSTLVVSDIKGFEVLKVPEIIMCQADGYCTIITLTGNRKIVSTRNLKHFEELLEGHSFIRAHNSFLVNIAHVCSYSRQGEIFLTGGIKASLGESYKSTFIKQILKK